MEKVNNNIVLVKKMKENPYFKEMGISKIITSIAYLDKLEVNILVTIDNDEIFRCMFKICSNSKLTCIEKAQLYVIISTVDLERANLISYIACDKVIQENNQVIEYAMKIAKYKINDEETTPKVNIKTSK